MTKVVFYASDKPREHMLANAFKTGILQLGYDFEMRRSAEYGETIDGDDLRWAGPSEDTDIVVFFGVKGKSRRILDDHLAMGRHTIMLDKGFSRSKGEGGHTEYSRVIIDAPTPADYMMNIKCKSDRFDRLGIELVNRRKARGGHVLFCGSTAKYHDFHKIGEPTQYAEHTFRKLRHYTSRHFVYRPKPSAKAAPGVAGASYSWGSTSISEALRGCHLVVTHGSSAALDAVISGIPAMVLGKSVASPVAETDIANVEQPFFPEPDLRAQWAAAMAYCQWTNDELRSGEAFTHCLSQMRKVK